MVHLHWFFPLQELLINVIGLETAEVYGTIRTLTQEMSLLIQKRVRQIAEGVAASFGMEVDIMLKQGGYLPVEIIQPWLKS